jgi:hypothetical protein
MIFKKVAKIFISLRKLPMLSLTKDFWFGGGGEEEEKINK